MSITQADKAKKFRALHKLPATAGARIEAAEPGAFIIPNPWDGGSARILAGLGFEALATTSSGFAFTLGRRDGAATRDEVLAHCRAIVAVTDLPVAADLENCFGDDPKTVAETIRLAASAGIVGGSVEDSTGDERRPIHEFSLAVERVAAAVEAARALPFPFTLTARTENFLHGRQDLDDTIKRLEAFAEAGADVLFAPGLPNLEAIKLVCAAVRPRPVNVLAGIKGLNFSRRTGSSRLPPHQPGRGAVTRSAGRFARRGARNEGTRHFLFRRHRRLHVRNQLVYVEAENRRRNNLGLRKLVWT